MDQSDCSILLISNLLFSNHNYIHHMKDKRMLSTVFEEICLARKKWKELAVELKVDDKTIQRIGDQSNGDVESVSIPSLMNGQVMDAKTTIMLPQKLEQ